MKKDDKVYLHHILDAIKNIEDFTEGLNKEKFLKSKLIQDGVLRNLEIIGEATKQLSEEFKDSNADIEWKKIAGMRDILIHNYLGVDIEIVWGVIENRLSDLSKKVSKFI